MEGKINEDYLLLLVNNSGTIEFSTISIDKHFIEEADSLERLCENDNDNIDEIINFINLKLRHVLPNKTFKYCIELDKPYQGVDIYLDKIIQNFLVEKNSIYDTQNFAIRMNWSKAQFDLDKKILELKKNINETLKLCFKAFDIEFAYDMAKTIPNMLVYSHRISGWSNPAYQIADSLKLEVKTNFGYGSVSYFYSLLTYKNILITPFSDWINYRDANFYQIIRYTRNHYRWVPVTYTYRGGKKGRKKITVTYLKKEINNEDWNRALDFTKNAANLLLTDENEFINKYIISECEAMVYGLNLIYNDNKSYEDEVILEEVDCEDEDIDEDEDIYEDDDYASKERKIEKIIGALDFINRIIEYNAIVPTHSYVSRIFDLAKKFIPCVHNTLDEQKKAHKNVSDKYNKFRIANNKLLSKIDEYLNAITPSLQYLFLTKEFGDTYDKNEDYKKFKKIIDICNEHKKWIDIFIERIDKLNNYISKYRESIK